MFLYSLKKRMMSDSGALGTAEMLLLLALAVFAVMAVTKYIMGPILDSSKSIGESIKGMEIE